MDIVIHASTDSILYMACAIVVPLAILSVILAIRGF